MKVDFYYWSYQCPLNNSMLELLREYEDRLDISYHDISQNFELAQKMNMFFPTLTVVNNIHRYFSPLKKALLDSLCEDKLPIEKPYRPSLGTIEKNVIIQPINENNYQIACECTGKNCSINCNKKLHFLKDKNIIPFGYINVDENNSLLGGVEYMPSLLVPYKIPKDHTTAFLTCVYLSDADFDYKSGPLKKLEMDLSLKYDKVIVISDETGVFPNGDMKFFIKNGYTDMGIVFKEKNYCTLHMLYKDI